MRSILKAKLGVLKAAVAVLEKVAEKLEKRRGTFGPLTDHAERELRLAGHLDEDGLYNGEMGRAVLRLIALHASEGHSGMSNHIAVALFSKLANFENLTDLTSNPDEWRDISEEQGEPCWQSKRNPRVFSRDGGKTWENLNRKGNVQ